LGRRSHRFSSRRRAEAFLTKALEGEYADEHSLGDYAAACQALAEVMAKTHGLSYEAVLAWYLKTMSGLDNLDQARDAVKGLIEEPFVAATNGYEEQDRQAYREHHWIRLKEVLGLTESFCEVCGQWYTPGPHTCP
jgi:hypothetical protein